MSKNKILAAIGTVGIALTTFGAAPLAYAGDTPNVSYPSGKGGTSSGISIKMNAQQYRFWKRHMGGGQNSGPGRVHAWQAAIGTQNREAMNAVGNGAGKVTSLSPVVQTKTCYTPIKQEKDSKTGKTTYFFSKNLLEKKVEEGWTSKGEAAGMCAATQKLDYISGQTTPKDGKLVAAAYTKDVWDTKPAGVQKSTTPPPKSDPDCAKGAAGLNAEAKKKPSGRVPKGGYEPGGNGTITNGKPLSNGCMYTTPGFIGKLSTITGDGGMYCIRGWNFGQEYQNDLSTVKGAVTAKAEAGTPWDTSKGVIGVKKSAYGNSPSWENCADDAFTFQIDHAALAKEGKEILPSGLGRYSNNIYMYKDNPTIEITGWDGNGAPSGVKIVGHDYSTSATHIQLQQGCQTKFLKDNYSQEEDANQDLRAQSMTHYEVGGNIPDRYVDVYIVNDPSNASKDQMARTPLSYTASDCMYKPGVTRKDTAYLCGTGQRPTGDKGNLNTKIESKVTDLDTTWKDSRGLYENNPGTTLDEGTNTGLDGELKITRSGDPTYLRWGTPTVLIDKSRSNSGKDKADITSNTRISSTLTLGKSNGKNPAEVGTPWVDTPKARILASNKAEGYNHRANSFDPKYLKTVRSSFAPKDNVNPEASSSGLPGAKRPVVEPTVSQLQQGGGSDPASAPRLDFRVYSPKDGSTIDKMSVAGTQDKEFANKYPAHGETPTSLTGKKSGGTSAMDKPIHIVPGDTSTYRLDRIYNTYDMAPTQLSAGVGATWDSLEKTPQKIASATFINGNFPMTQVYLKNAKADGMNRVKFDFGQIEKSLPATLTCISGDTDVYALKPVG